VTDTNNNKEADTNKHLY